MKIRSSGAWWAAVLAYLVTAHGTFDVISAENDSRDERLPTRNMILVIQSNAESTVEAAEHAKQEEEKAEEQAKAEAEKRATKIAKDEKAKVEAEEHEKLEDQRKFEDKIREGVEEKLRIEADEKEKAQADEKAKAEAETKFNAAYFRTQAARQTNLTHARAENEDFVKHRGENQAAFLTMNAALLERKAATATALVEKFKAVNKLVKAHREYEREVESWKESQKLISEAAAANPKPTAATARAKIQLIVAKKAFRLMEKAVEHEVDPAKKKLDQMVYGIERTNEAKMKLQMGAADHQMKKDLKKIELITLRKARIAKQKEEQEEAFEEEAEESDEEDQEDESDEEDEEDGEADLVSELRP
jgi:hypothetical protein